MGIITSIPVANDVNRDEALIRTPIPAANGGNRYEATMSISEELQRQNDRLPVATESDEQNHVEPQPPRGLTRDCSEYPPSHTRRCRNSCVARFSIGKN